MMKKTLILFFLCLSCLEAQNSNDFYFMNYDPMALFTNRKALPRYAPADGQADPEAGRLYRTDILYGNFENLDAHIIMSRESRDIGTMVTYNRFKINSFNTNGKKVYNSAYGFDAFSAGVHLNLLKDLSLNFSIDYNYRYSGMLFNTNYNNQFKRRVLFSPQLKYFLTERSILNFNFLYSNLNLEFESPVRSLFNQHSFFQTEIIYRRIWSSVNSFTFRILNIQDSQSAEGEERDNNYARFGFSDKFALSRMFILNAGLALDVNKNYPFTLSPLLGFSFLFPGFNVQTAYERLYDLHPALPVIAGNDFFKYGISTPPCLDDRISLTFFLPLSEALTFTSTVSFDHYRNYPFFGFDREDLAYPRSLKEMDLLKLTQEIRVRAARGLSFHLQYRALPYQRPEKIFRIYRNEADLAAEMESSPLSWKLVLRYQDMNYFLDNRNDYIIIKSNVLADILVQLHLTRSFGILLKARNLACRRVFNIPMYPSLESIFNAGITAGF